MPRLEHDVPGGGFQNALADDNQEADEGGGANQFVLLAEYRELDSPQDAPERMVEIISGPAEP